MRAIDEGSGAAATSVAVKVALPLVPSLNINVPRVVEKGTVLEPFDPVKDVAVDRS